MLSPNPDGSLSGGRAAVVGVDVPLNSLRLQGTVSHRGIADLFVWGSGAVGKLLFEPPLDEASTIEVRPNLVTFALPGGHVRVAALPNLPAIVVEFAGVAASLRLAPSRRHQPGFADGFVTSPLEDGWHARSPWAAATLRARQGTVQARGRVSVPVGTFVVLALGATPSEAEVCASAVIADPEAAVRTATEYAERLESAFGSCDPLLNTMFTSCLHAATSSRKELADGSFAGYSAGTGYVMPPRTYFRDSYWTLQSLLPFDPDAALDQLRLLAGAVGDDGEAPSGVIVASEAGARVWEARLAADPGLAADHRRAGQWWSDHFDSPYYFVLLARDALTWSTAGAERAEDALNEVLHEPLAGVRLVDTIRAVLQRGRRLAGAGVLPVKPEHDRDWADNVFRHGHVTYDVALYHGALVAAAELFAAAYPDEAAGYRARAEAVRQEASKLLFDAVTGHFVEFRPHPDTGRYTGESHLTLDSLVAVRTGLATDEQAKSMVAAASRILETRSNHEQPYGNWGVMCAYPPYRGATRRRGKSLFPYRYHNGSDWPYLDGIYAEALLALGAAGWRYPLTRWFEYGLQQGWPTPVEYYSPAWGRGSPLNGWSAMPAAAMLLGGFGLRPVGTPRPPPWGDSRLEGVLVNGRRSSVVSVAGRVEVTAHE